MNKNLRWKLLVIAGVTGLAIWSFTPPKDKVKLGLDLKGGVQMIYRVETDDAIRIETETSAEQFHEVLKTSNVTVGAVKPVGLSEFTVEGVNPASDAQFRQIAQTQLGLSYDRDSTGGGGYTFKMKPNIAVQRRTEAVQQAIQTIDRRVNELGVSEPIVAPYGTTNDQIIVQLPGVQDVNHAKSIIKNTAILEIKLVEGGPMSDEKTLLSTHGDKVPEGMDVVPGVSGARGDTTRVFYLVKKVSAI